MKLMQATRLLGIVVLVGLIAGGIVPALAQGGPPTILEFSADRAFVELAETEAGTAQATLRWQTAGLSVNHRVLLYAYRVQDWEMVSTPENAPLASAGTLEVTIRHPLNFGAPTYKLVIVDASNRVLDERILTINYAAGELPPPQIVNFTAEQTPIDFPSLAQGTARVTVKWEVINRQPYTNLVFEQVLPDGSTQQVELPRSVLWVSSVGAGEVAPILPPNGQPVVLRLRLVDVRASVSLDDITLDPLPVLGTLTPGQAVGFAPVQPAITLVPGVSGGSAPGVVIDSFTVTPSSVMRGSIVTLNWSVSGASEIAVWRLSPTGELAESAPNPTAVGSWMLALDPVYTGSAGFVLFATNANGRQMQASATVRVQCGMLYFFGVDSQGGCPAGDARTVQASYQLYEHGMMLWRADTSEIFVLYEGGQLGRYMDTWRGELIAVNVPAPPGIVPPQRSFGKVWTEQQSVRANLGWAIRPEVSYTMRFQPALGGRMYATLPDGTVIYMTESAWDYERRMPR